MLAPYKSHWAESFEQTYHGSADLYVYFCELGLRLLKPGGRLAYIVTNKWLKSGYAEKLRRYLANEVWLDEVVDLGHARQVFPDADVFPSLLVAEKPSDREQPADVRACIIPRDILRTEQLAQQITTGAYPILRTRLGAEPWTLDPPEVNALVGKLRGAGIPLPEFVGVSPQIRRSRLGSTMPSSSTTRRARHSSRRTPAPARSSSRACVGKRSRAGDRRAAASG